MVAAGNEPTSLYQNVDIRIARDGTWFHEGRPIRRKSLVVLFSSILRRESDGCYYLVTPVERHCIVVEDVPFVVVEANFLQIDNEPAIRFRTNVDDVVFADQRHPVRVDFDPQSGTPTPYVTVRDGIEARINRPVYYELVDNGRVITRNLRDILGIDSCGCFFELGAIDDDA